MKVICIKAVFFFLNMAPPDVEGHKQDYVQRYFMRSCQMKWDEIMQDEKDEIM